MFLWLPEALRIAITVQPLPIVIVLPPSDPELIPIGGIHLSLIATDPAVGFGYGTWDRLAQGRFLVGLDETDPDFDTPSETGGAKQITPAGSNSVPTFTGTSDIATSAISAGTPAGTNSVPTFTGAALGTHNHTFTGTAHSHELPFQLVSATTTRQLAAATFGTGTSRAAQGQDTAHVANTTSAAVALSQSVTAAGTNTAITAGTPAGTVTAPTFTGSALGTHSHTLTPTGTVTAPTFSGTPESNLPPFLTCYMWVRTA